MIKRERITLAQAQNAIEIYKQIPIRFTEVELEDTLEIVSAYQIYAYDAYLIRCAVKYMSSLITLDRKLAQVANEMNVAVIEVKL
jgi:predicted nucleic acid-binding protein